jgi:uncharacterized protein
VFPFAKEQAVQIPGPVGCLEAMLHQASAEGHFAARNWLVLLCHPHPLHGGTMDNKVVTTLMRTYRDLGIHVLRFNFRGVGSSQGEFDNAKGEQDDLLAVAAWAKAQLPEVKLLLAGFSFGSSVAAQVAYRLDAVEHLTLVAPPIERYAYDRDGLFPCPVCIVQGDKDERVMAEGVYAWQAQLRGTSSLLRYPEAGHFFHGYLSQLKSDLTQMLMQQL